MKSRYIANISMGFNHPTQHVAAPNIDWAWETGQAKAMVLAERNPGQEVKVELYRWEKGIWQWLDSATHLVLQAMPEDLMDDYSTLLAAERTN
jgi:hypothetical protein